MKLPPHAMALDLHLFESVVQKSAGMGSLPELMCEFAPYIGKRELTLDCPQEEVLVNPPPSYIFVLNEDLCGVYPTLTGVYIRKPLERGEEVMVLQPGFQGTKAVYYYHNNKSQLFVLCEDNRKLIIYDLTTSSEPTSTSVKVSGLPESKAHYDRGNGSTEMACTNDFVFILFGTKYLFCIDRSNAGDWAQAKLIWRLGSRDVDNSHLFVDARQPLAVRVVLTSASRHSRSSLLTLVLESRHEPLCFKEITDELALPITPGGGDIVCDVLPVGASMLAMARRSSNHRENHVTLCGRSLHPLGPPAPQYDSDVYRESRGKQLVCGESDVIYSMEEGRQFKCSFEDYDYDDLADDDDDLRAALDMVRATRDTGEKNGLSVFSRVAPPSLPLGMKLPAHAIALDVHLFESMVQRSAGMVSQPELLCEFAPYIGKRELTLDCPREEVLVNPPPSYIFVMNEDLCGVYPTPTGVYIRKPLERWEEVMVLQPGFQDTKAVYYYHNNESQLFVLCEDNRRLIIYDLKSSPKPTSIVVEVLGLPGSKSSYMDESGVELACTDDFVFVLSGAQRIFCIDRLGVVDSAQAKLIWSARFTMVENSHLMIDPREPRAAQLILSCSSESQHPWVLLALQLKTRREPLYFSKAFSAITPQVSRDEDEDEEATAVYDIQPVGHHVLAVHHAAPFVGEEAITLCNRQMYALGPPMPLLDLYEYHEPQRKQLVCGERDLIYTIGDASFDAADINNASARVGNKKRRVARRPGSASLIGSYYVSKK
ncbi:hypothetical protein FOZ61_009386 [Perkinsus olseni]|uniref:Uncharacterized protein n=1 Tax=Perkinsus olseni TaxID=32597 RepID=A0A7J6M582_PEROL|nr:hypothetical protein FOZ61_009386 [Perkinsus olseni]